MPDSNNFSKQYSRLGSYSRYAGLGFIALSAVLLVLSAYDQFIVFEIDSVAAFLVAVFLLFRDPRARVQAGVLEAVLGSADQAIGELSALSKVSFTYTPAGGEVDRVVVVAQGPKKRQRANATQSPTPPSASREVTPPGRGLATLFVREAGIDDLTMDKLRASLPGAMRERFSLAASTEIVSDGDAVHVTLQGATTTCACVGSAADGPSPKGSIGCPVASFVAVLVCAAARRPLTLKPCTKDDSTGAWKISMSLGVSAPAEVPAALPDASQIPVTVK